MQPGDIRYSIDASSTEGRYRPFKVLKLESFGQDGEVAHVIIYREMAEPPALAMLDRLQVWILHTPIAADSFGDTVLVANRPVTPEELEGYLEYLKRTDFRRYAKVTGQSVDELIGRAQAAFREGHAHSERGDHAAAIRSYEAASDAFPLYYEAIDNRAFCYMDMAKWESAISVFEESIAVNGHTVLTDFSIGECYYRLGDAPNAREWLERARKLGPDEKLARAIDRMMARMDASVPRP